MNQMKKTGIVTMILVTRDGMMTSTMRRIASSLQTPAGTLLCERPVQAIQEIFRVQTAGKQIDSHLQTAHADISATSVLTALSEAEITDVSKL
jgi:hypothetical protein